MFFTRTFFNNFRCKAKGTHVHPSQLKDEWEDHWHRFVLGEWRNLKEDDTNRLFRRYGIRQEDIRDYHIRRKKRELEKSKSPSVVAKEEEPVTVINTLKLIYAVEQHLEHLGQKVTFFMSKAKLLEARSGKASDLLENQEFVDLLNEAREILLTKLNAENQPEQLIKVVRTVVDKIVVLLQKTSLKPKSSQALDTSKFDQDPIKCQIAKTIISHFKDTLKKDLTQEILDSLVASEFERIVNQQLQQQMQQQQQQARYHQAPSYHQSHPSAHQNYGAPPPAQMPPQIHQFLSNAMKMGSTGQAQPYQEPAPTQMPPEIPPERAPEIPSKKPEPGPEQIPGLEAATETPSSSSPPKTSNSSSISAINWDALSNAVKIASTTAPSEPVTTSTEKSKVEQISSYPPGPENHLDDDEDLDDLSLEELTSLLNNYKELDGDTQKQLMAYMKKIEKSNPKKVTELRNYRNSKK